MGIFGNKEPRQETSQMAVSDDTKKERVLPTHKSHGIEEGRKRDERLKIGDVKEIPTAEDELDGSEVSSLTKEDEEQQKILEVIRQSFLQQYLDESSTVTDISYNGTTLRVQDNVKGRFMPENQPTEDEVHKLAFRIANVKGKEFNDSEPILDEEIAGLRINAVHRIVSPDGTTMAVRVSRPRLAITDLSQIADDDVAQLLKVLMKAGESLIISGITGSGKTEVQKALVGAMDDSDKITLVEDSRDSHIKALYPEKDINSWRSLTGDSRQNKITFSILIKAALRNNPDWLLISEIRGSDAYDFNNALLTGHSGLTTIHANGAKQIPSRLRNMIAQEYDVNPVLLGQDIVENLRFGMHMEMRIDKTTGEITRKCREIVEYIGYGNTGVISSVIYEDTKEYDKGEYITVRIKRPLSERTISRLKDKELYHEIPKVFIPKEKSGSHSNESRPVNVNPATARAPKPKMAGTQMVGAGGSVGQGNSPSLAQQRQMK